MQTPRSQYLLTSEVTPINYSYGGDNATFGDFAIRTLSDGNLRTAEGLQLDEHRTIRSYVMLVLILHIYHSNLSANFGVQRSSNLLMQF
jgi:hypothetical protein